MNTPIKIATLCSHSALQIFHGAKQEGIKTIGICTPERQTVYNSFPLATPDDYLIVDRFQDIMNTETQETLNENNAIIIPHGSFVEYVGAKNIIENLEVPVFGNKHVLEWESNRDLSHKWMEHAKLARPQTLHPTEIKQLSIVKFHGAKGGRGFFLTDSPDDYQKKIQAKINANTITATEAKNVIIQEYIIGVRYYPHYFQSAIHNRIELMSVDQRVESNVDGLARLHHHKSTQPVDPSYIVTGNLPIIFRESLLPQILAMGTNTITSSQHLFPPGLIGPFSIECICTPDLEFITFEISARIVAGTNLYPHGSPYTWYAWSEPMSTGRRIAREIKHATNTKKLEEITS